MREFKPTELDYQLALNGLKMIITDITRQYKILKRNFGKDFDKLKIEEPMREAWEQISEAYEKLINYGYEKGYEIDKYC